MKPFTAATPGASSQLLPAYALVVGRGISAFGAVLTTFALNVWVYRVTGSYQTFALLSVLAMLPGVLVSPLAGVWIDRLPKKRVLLGCELAALAATVAAGAGYAAGRLALGQVAVTMFIYATAEAFRWSALGATISLLTPPDRLARVNGVAESCRALTVMGGPVTGAAILQWLGMGTILGLTSATYVILLATLLVIRIAETRDERAFKAARRSAVRGLWRDLQDALSWLRNRPELCRLLGYFAAANFAFSVFVVTQVPFVLAFSNAHALGLCFAADGMGVLTGGLCFSRFAQRRNLDRLIVAGITAEAVTMVVWSLSRINGLLYACAFGIGLLASIVNAASQTIWQSAVPIDFQGRVLSLRMMAASSLAPLAVLLSVPLSARLFAPLVSAGAWFVAPWGSGQAAVLGLMVAMLAVLIALLSLALSAYGGLDIRLAEPERSAS